MRTYLDAYISRLRKELERAVGSKCDPDFPGMLHNMCTRDPYFSVGHGLQSDSDELRFFHDIHPFVEPESFETSPIALMLMAETVDAFRNGDVNGSVKTVAGSDIRLARAAYFDLPHGSFPVGENMQIRAFVAVPDGAGLRFTAAVGLRGSNRARHFSWTAGSDAVSGGGEINASATKLPDHFALGITVTDYEEPIEHLLGSGPCQIRKLLREIETVAQLAVAQRRSILDGDQGPAMVELPHVALADPRRRTGNRKKTDRENSFFRIQQMPHMRGIAIEEEDRTNRDATVDSDHTCPRRRVEVRGFFRMQPYGPRRSLRRLTWIPAFMRWVRDDGRVEMRVLRRPTPAIVPDLDDLIEFAEAGWDASETPIDEQIETSE